MGYATLTACVEDLERTGRLVRVTAEVDPHLELAAIQRRAFRKGGPALLFTNVKGCAFPMLANLYGAKERIRYIFRDALPLLEHLFRVKADPVEALRRPARSLGLPLALWRMLPRTVRRGSVTECRARLSDLPRLVSWPKDGGPFVTLPLVYTEHPDKPGYAGSNLGMYRIQLAGNAYAPDAEAGLHYQVHRGIAAHHAAALRRGEALRAHVAVGGPPALTLAAVMPLPEGLSELHFAGVLAGMRIPMLRAEPGGLPMPAHADFCISGRVLPGCKPEGPFGDHLGYYSLTHDFPVLRVDAVRHRKNAVWPFTTVGRPPQEDTLFGEFIHDLTGPLVPQVFPGVHEIHAVDAAGVHPLLLAVGSERYVPYAEERRPLELLTCAMALLGGAQTALAKYVFIAAREDAPPSVRNVREFFRHMLERTDFSRDLHFLTRAPMDTLDYTGTELNAGSKLIWAAAGEPRRTLGTEAPPDLSLPPGFDGVRLAGPGILVLRGSRHEGARGEQDGRMENLARALGDRAGGERFPLVVVADDADFMARSWDDFLWAVFTRSDPATDIYGVRAAVRCKHWSCEAPLVLDARLKSFQAPPLEEDPDVVRRVEAMGARGKPLYGLI